MRRGSCIPTPGTYRVLPLSPPQQVVEVWPHLQWRGWLFPCQAAVTVLPAVACGAFGGRGRSQQVLDHLHLANPGAAVSTVPVVGLQGAGHQGPLMVASPSRVEAAVAVLALSVAPNAAACPGEYCQVEAVASSTSAAGAKAPHQGGPSDHLEAIAKRHRRAPRAATGHHRAPAAARAAHPNPCPCCLAAAAAFHAVGATLPRGGIPTSHGRCAASLGGPGLTFVFAASQSATVGPRAWQ